MTITPELLTTLEQNMRSITSNEYSRLNRNTWWRTICKTMPIKAKKETIHWLLETARIIRPNASHGGGQQVFDELVSLYTELEAENAIAGLQLKKEQLEDLENGIVGGEGFRLAASWSRQVGAHAGYWPQECLYKGIHLNPVGYDGVAYFHAAHPLNPYDTVAGTYANLFTGAASGVYPGALPIHGVTVDVAVENVAKAIAYITSIKMPNGQMPRNLRPRYLLHPPTLTARAQQITNAKYIAQAAAAGGGSGDVEAVIKNFGLGEPLTCPELGSAFGGSDTSWYLAMEDILDNELGAWVFADREPFSVAYHGPQTDAQLSRIRQFEWHLEGRNSVQPGHPFLLFRCAAT